ncbi:hypothetical protein [Methanoculleus sp.]|nr:hypothetical protein [Methanoculleus sp.]
MQADKWGILKRQPGFVHLDLEDPAARGLSLVEGIRRLGYG